MIIMLLVMNVLGIFPNTQFSIDNEYSLYPTVGEIYEYYLEKFVAETQLMCKMYPEVPNVKVINQCEEIYTTQGNQFVSISSNNTHFGTLTNNNEVIIYEWKNSMIQQIGQPMTINSSFNCFNINLSQNFSILVDCYYNNEFILIQFIDAQSIFVHQIQSSLPTSTKIQSIVNGTNAFIVYAQYFENYSILSLFSSQFQNQSSLNYQFVDYDITVTISPHIYAITSQEIFELLITPDSQFNIIDNFTQDGMSNFTTINVYYDFQSQSQCDQIYLIYSEGQIAPFQECENQIIMIWSNVDNLPSIQKIYQSNLFIIYQSIDTIFIYQQYASNYYSYSLKNQGNSLLYFNSDTVKKQIFLQINIINRENLDKANNSLLNVANIIPLQQYTFQINQIDNLWISIIQQNVIYIFSEIKKIYLYGEEKGFCYQLNNISEKNILGLTVMNYN